MVRLDAVAPPARERTLNWWTDLKLIGAALVGLLLAFLLAPENTFKSRLVTAVAGLFCCFYGTEPVIAWAGDTYAAAGWPYLIAGALALTGDRLVRRAIRLIDTLHVPWPGGGK